jgi:phage gp37-like protein
MVVTNDRLETIVDAVVEGRAMWSSVRDALGILVGGNLGRWRWSRARASAGFGRRTAASSSTTMAALRTARRATDSDRYGLVVSMTIPPRADPVSAPV